MSSCQDDVASDEEVNTTRNTGALTAEQAMSLYPYEQVSGAIADELHSKLDFGGAAPHEVTIDRLREIDHDLPGLNTSLDHELHDEPDGFVVSLIEAVGHEVHVTGEANTHTTLEDIRTDLIGRLISVEVRITDQSKQFPIHTVAALKCQKCRTYQEQVLDINSQDKVGDIDQCDGCEAHPKHLQLDFPRTVSVDAQQAIIQDLHTVTSSSNPTDLKVNFYGSMVNSVRPGETVTLTGIVRAQDMGDTFEYYIDAVGLEHHDEDYSGVKISDEEEERIKKIADSDHVHSRLKASIAPGIKGDYDLARSALLLQQFGGVERDGPDKDRHTIHAALIGDPGTGKSDLARYTQEIAPNGVYKAADKSTRVGLTAAVTREERFNNSEWTLQGGALVQADGGHAVVDELDKAPDKLQGALHTPLSEMKVEVSKASISATLPARCSVTLVANPDNERFDPRQNVPSQIPLNDALWSRMDAIIPFVDQPDEDADAEIADSILASAQGQQPDIVEKDLMRKYIAYARRTDPVISDEAREHIKSEWTELRQKSTAEKVAVGPRQLRSMLKFAEASARVRLSEKVTKEDAERAVDIVKRWMEQVAKDEAGDWNVDAYTSSTDLTQHERKKLIYRFVQDLSKEGDEPGAERDKVVSILVEKYIDERTAQQEINALVGKTGALDQDDGKLYDIR